LDNPKEIEHMGEQCVDGKVIIKSIFNKKRCMAELNLCGLKWSSEVPCCEHDNESSGSVSCIKSENKKMTGLFSNIISLTLIMMR
jgi:hypothetical protein